MTEFTPCGSCAVDQFGRIIPCKLHRAAPDLLAALERTTKGLDFAINLTPTGSARNRLCDMNIEAHAAIAKARPQATSPYLRGIARVNHD